MIRRFIFWRAALATGLMAVAVPASAYAQAVSGVIRSEETHQPIAGAQVRVEGTDLVTISNAQGMFQIAGLEGDEVELRVQVIGYQTVTVTVPVGSQDNEILLPGTAIALDGIVVSALGIAREARSLGYSVATVQTEQLTVNRTPNFMDALQGQMAGVNITSMAGAGPQASSRVRIRGLSSLGAHNSPLIVVNGTPIDNTTFGVGGQYDERGGSRNVDQGDGLASLNPDDIVEMTVLKGAAGAALYGARAKDGVIMITTRNRADGTGVTFTYDSHFTAGTIHDRRNYQMEYGQGENGRRPTSSFPVTGVWSFGEKFEPGMTQILFDGVEVPYEAQPNQLKEFYRNSYDAQNTVTAAEQSAR
jgi:TonB-dependent SusC/RagA subfamily outer membrane receptor